MAEAEDPSAARRGRDAPRAGRDAVRVYTRHGDAGTTSLRIGGRVRKDDPHIELVGTIDEAQAFLGLARAEAGARVDLAERLLALERDLWILMAQAATPLSAGEDLVPGVTAITSEMVRALEAEIDERVANDELPTGFTVPGENRLAAALDVARTIVRRAERVAVAHDLLAPTALAYLNRLSDLCWVLARSAEHVHRVHRPAE